MRALHAYMTLAWIFIIPLSFWLRESLIWVVFMSHYAIIVGHWSSWQAARTEVKQDGNEGG